MNNIARTVSRSIREQKWISIHYENGNHEESDFWCCVLDIVVLADQRKKLTVHQFNQEKLLTDTTIYFERIKDARVVEGTFYEVPESLIAKIEMCQDGSYDWLYYDEFDGRVLDYLNTCYIHDIVPAHSEYKMAEGIDADRVQQTSFPLDQKQMNTLLGNLLHINDAPLNQKIKYELVFNVLSIENHKKRRFLIAFRSVFLNVKEHSLYISPEIQVNRNFWVDPTSDRPQSLNGYVDEDAETFIANLSQNFQACLETLEKNKIPKERIITSPLFLTLEKQIQVPLNKTFDAIKQAHTEKRLAIPMQAFFGSQLPHKRQLQCSMLLLDEWNNIDQVRAIYNSMALPMTYIQGPPGTGKTQTILNILISAFMNDRTVLLTSNNNKPVDDLYEKCLHIFGDFSFSKYEPFPIIRIGKQNENIEAVKRIRMLIEQSSNVSTSESNMERSKARTEMKYKDLQEFMAKVETWKDWTTRLEQIEEQLSELPPGKIAEYLKMQQAVCKQKIAEIGDIKDGDVKQYTHAIKGDRTALSWMFGLAFSRIKKLSEKSVDTKYLGLKECFKETDDDKAASRLMRFLKNDENLQVFLSVFPFVVTTNLSANKLGSPNINFDMAIMDEAGQCNIATSLIPICRANSLVLVGDVNQLQPVVILDPQENKKIKNYYQIKDDKYDYCNNSIIKLMQNNDKTYPKILLRYHYRCGKRIIDFSNALYYDNQLKIDKPESDEQLELLPVQNSFDAGNRNAAAEEADQVLDVVEQRKYNKDNCAIITPFRNQANLLIKRAAERNLAVDIGTIHTFQGDQKKTIILSTSLCEKTPSGTFDWMKDNRELLNVATTRAEDKLICAIDINALSKFDAEGKSDISRLVKHITTKGIETKINPPTKKRAFFKSFLTSYEKDFKTQIEQIQTIINNIHFREQVALSSLIKYKKIAPENQEYALRQVFDFVLFTIKDDDAIAAFEIDGDDHLEPARIIADRHKEEICKEIGLNLIRVPNDMTFRYDLIKQAIIQAIKEAENVSLV